MLVVSRDARLQYEDLIRAVVAAPDDDFPRLQVADWMDDNGQPGRAEFIRTQLEIANLEAIVNSCGRCYEPTCPACGAYPVLGRLLAREDELVAEHAWRWLRGELPDDIHYDYEHWHSHGGYIISQDEDEQDVFYHRGFLRKARLPLSVWMRHGKAMIASAPIQHVQASCRQPERRTYVWGERWAWSWVNDDVWPRHEWRGTFPWCLPASVWRLTKVGRGLTFFYPSRDKAMIALSEAMMEHARGRTV